MEILLNNTEARILGAFIEKELTTPDYYPLSSNALTNACNQKSNRDPVLQLDEAEVMDAVAELRKKGLAMQSREAGSRVDKSRHTLRERLYLDEPELAVLAELLLRGRSVRQAPDVDGQVYITSGQADVGDIVALKITDSSEDELVGEICEEWSCPGTAL